MKSVIALSALAGMVLLGPAHDSFRPGSFRFDSVRHSTTPETGMVARADAHPAMEEGSGVHPVVRSRLHPAGQPVSEVQSRCRYEAQRDLTLSAGPGDAFRLEAGSGSLEVMGVAGLDEIRVVARACASEEGYLEDLRVSSRRDGAEIFVETHYPDVGRWSWTNGYARLDLRIQVPEGMVADIRDSSGEMRIEHLGSLRIQDGSGGMEVFSIQGDVLIDDNSGEILLRDVTGDVEIDDGSGEMHLEGIGGTVTLRDGSGEIDVLDVEGTVRVIRDGSGSINVDGVGGDFIVERDGSGGIEFRDVQGRVEIPKKR